MKKQVRKNTQMVAQVGPVETIQKKYEYFLPHLLGTVHSGVVKRQTVMILPQVHLRKPCYDFYFL